MIRGLAGMKVLTDRELEALVTLLGDEDRRTARIAREHLIGAGERALPFLAEGARAGDPLIRGRARLLLEELRQADLESRFAAFGARSDADLDLEEGAILVARIGNPDVDPTGVSAALDQLADGVRDRVPLDMPAADRVQILGRYLGAEVGLRAGGVEEPEHSFIDRVLERKVGVPILLSTIYILVGRRLGIAIRGVGLPGHFIARADLPTGVVYLDPAGGGRTWGRADCFAYLRSVGIAPTDAYLRPTTVRRMVARMVANLISSLTQRGEEPRAAQLHRLLDVLGTRDGGG